MQVLIVVDMQNDFIEGTLGSPEAKAIVKKVAEKIRSFPGRVLYTQDTHGQDYLTTQEGSNLPIEHCLRGSWGWQLHPEIEALCREVPVEKNTFGSIRLGQLLSDWNEKEPVCSVELIGLCTDICVISNAMIVKAFLPEAQIRVDASCCAGVTPESHQIALDAMRSCQIHVSQSGN